MNQNKLYYYSVFHNIGCSIVFCLFLFCIIAYAVRTIPEVICMISFGIVFLLIFLLFGLEALVSYFTYEEKETEYEITE